MTVPTARTRENTAAQDRAPDLVRWGPVAAAAVIGLGLFALLNALWLAIAHSADDGWVSGNLAWFIGASAALSLFVAGLVAGVLAGVRGTGAGLANGITAWGLLFILSLTAIIPGAFNLTTTLGAGLQEGADDVSGSVGAQAGGVTVETAMWTGFWSLLIGLALAALGGVLGGRIRRPVEVPEQHPRGQERMTSPTAAPTETVVVDRATERRR